MPYVHAVYSIGIKFYMVLPHGKWGKSLNKQLCYVSGSLQHSQTQHCSFHQVSIFLNWVETILKKILCFNHAIIV